MYICHAYITKAPVYLLNSMFDTWDSHDPHGASSCMKSAECSSRRTWLAREQAADAAT